MSYLKIKDNVDSKELRKWGFSYWGNTDPELRHWYSIKTGTKIYKKDRRIDLYDKKAGNILLFDMIQAGLVEKVVAE